MFEGRASEISPRLESRTEGKEPFHVHTGSAGQQFVFLLTWREIGACWFAWRPAWRRRATGWRLRGPPGRGSAPYKRFLAIGIGGSLRCHPPFREASPMSSQLCRLFSAALGEIITDAAAYHALFRKYMGIDPLYPPLGQDCGGWVPAEELDESVTALLNGGVVRFGYVPNSPYVYGDGDDLTGFDHDLAAMALEKIVGHYALGPLAAKWVIADPGPVSEGRRIEI